MNPFVLSRNAYKLYCSEYVDSLVPTTVTNNNNNNSNQSVTDINHSSKYSTERLNHSKLSYDKALNTLNRRYEYFLQTLNRLQQSFGQITNAIARENRNINSVSNGEGQISTSSFMIHKKKKKKKYLHRSIPRRMPKVLVKVSCGKHYTQQHPNVKLY